jgi:hypothetical protein
MLPVTLQPGKTYATWFNFGKFNSFRDINNSPSVSYLLAYQTKSKLIPLERNGCSNGLDRDCVMP